MQILITDWQSASSTTVYYYIHKQKINKKAKKW